MILIHRCSTCGHNDLEGRARPSGGRLPAAKLVTCARSCTCVRHSFGPPEVAPSFTDAGRLVERLAPPGTQLHTGLTTCPCDDCKAEYDRLTAPGAVA